MQTSKVKPLRTLKRQLINLKNDKQKCRLCLVMSIFVISVMVVLTDILYITGSESDDHANDNSSNNLTESEDNSKVWETAIPLGIPLYRRNLRLYSSKLDTTVLLDELHIGDLGVSERHIKARNIFHFLGLRILQRWHRNLLEKKKTFHQDPSHQKTINCRRNVFSKRVKSH